MGFRVLCRRNSVILPRRSATRRLTLSVVVSTLVCHSVLIASTADFVQRVELETFSFPRPSDEWPEVRCLSLIVPRALVDALCAVSTLQRRTWKAFLDFSDALKLSVSSSFPSPRSRTDCTDTDRHLVALVDVESIYSLLSPTDVARIEQRLKRTSEFFREVICSFVLRDLGILLDKRAYSLSRRQRGVKTDAFRLHRCKTRWCVGDCRRRIITIQCRIPLSRVVVL